MWRANALRTLPVLMGATDMMVCGEDLGMIPACVHPVMERLGLLGVDAIRPSDSPLHLSSMPFRMHATGAFVYQFAGLRIQRMPSEVGQEFGDPANYPYMVVCSPSCHDTSTTRAWFEEEDGRRERFCSDVLGIHVRTCVLSRLTRQNRSLATPAVLNVHKLTSTMLTVTCNIACRARCRSAAHRKSSAPSSGCTWRRLPCGAFCPSRCATLAS